MISDSVRHLAGEGLEVIYDAEHFFDAYKGNSDYALATLIAAAEPAPPRWCCATPTAAASPPR